MTDAKSQTWVKRIDWALAAIVMLGLGLRLWGIGFGLPYLYHPDEGIVLQVVLGFFRTGDLNPNFYNWPSLLFYLNTLAYLALFGIGKWLGWFETPADVLRYDNVAIAVGKVELPAVILIGRALDVLAGTLAIIVVYRICRVLTPHKFAGWLAALWFAVETASVRESQFIRPDTLLVLFSLVSVYYALKIVDEPNAKNYALAGIAAGLATSFKYNAALVVIPIAVAHVLRFGWRGILRKEIYLAAAASLAAFFATTPYALLDWKRFWEIGPLEDVAHYAGGHAGSVGSSLAWYWSFLLTSPPWALPLALGESAIQLIQRNKKGIVLLAFPVVYFVFISFFAVHFEMMVLPVIPFVLICAGMFIARAYAWLAQFGAIARAFGIVAVFVIALFIAVPPLRTTAEYNVRILQPDGRETSRAWIENNLPPGARIAVEPYSPYLDRTKFMVEGTDGLTAQSPEWYTQNGVEYLVFSYGTYGRFYENRADYPEFIEKYETLFAQFPKVQRFNDNGFEIQIRKTGVANLPAQRVAGRFGIYAGWIELVGYDAIAAQAGKPIQIVLHWRTLEPRKEMLTITTRLIDRADQAIAPLSHTSLGVQRNEGMTRIPVTLAAPTEPGMYHIELNVDAEGVGRIPVLSNSRQQIADKLFIPIKIAPAPIPANELYPMQSVGARFGDTITLLGATARRNNDTLALTLFWQSAAKPSKDYTVFIHFLDSAGAVRAQLDAQPRGGAYPTSIWDPGEIVRDDYILTLPHNLAPGEYKITVGLYEYPSLTRLGATNANGSELGDHIVLPESVQISP